MSDQVTVKSVPNIPLFLHPCIIEQTNKTTPDYSTVLALEPSVDSMKLYMYTYQAFGGNQYKYQTGKGFVWESLDRKPVSKQQVTIGYTDAVILRNKLNQFISAYEASHDYSFVMTDEEPCASKQKSFLDDYDIPIPDKSSVDVVGLTEPSREELINKFKQLLSESEEK